MNIQEIRELLGINKTAFAKRYGIPYRTVQDWELGLRNPPEWLLPIMERIVKEDVALENRPKQNHAMAEALYHEYAYDMDGIALEEAEHEEAISTLEADIDKAGEALRYILEAICERIEE